MVKSHFQVGKETSCWSLLLCANFQEYHTYERRELTEQTRLLRTFPITVLFGVETRIPRDCSRVQGTAGFLGTPHMIYPFHASGN